MREPCLNAEIAIPPGAGIAAQGNSLGAESAWWYALTVKHQHERTIELALSGKGFEAFVPTYRARREWSDRMKEIELPLFSGYVFCRFPIDAKRRVLDTPAISRVVGFGGVNVPVPDAEIAALRGIVSSGRPVRPWPHLKPGDRVRIGRGPLRGVEGVLIREKDTLELVVSVELLQRSVAVDIDAATIEPVPLSLAQTRPASERMKSRP